MSHSHREHSHAHKGRAQKNLLIALVLNLSFAVIELFGGLYTNSVAILSDALHDFGDALSLEVIAGLCLVALSTRRSRRLFLNGAGAIIGAAASCWVRLGAPSATVLIVLGGLALVLVRDDARPWLGPVGGVVVGAGLGLRAGSWAFADGAGWVGAAALSAAIVIGIGWPLGGLLVRRPGLLTAIRWVSLAAVCFVSGIQLAR